MSDSQRRAVTVPGRVCARVERFVSRSRARPVLNDALVKGGLLCASDGKVMIRLPLEGAPDDHPAWRVPSEALRRRVSESLVIDLDAGRATVRSGDRDGAVYELKEDDPNVLGCYPDLDRLVESLGRDPAVARLYLQAPFLRALADVVDAIAAEEGLPMARVVLELQDGDDGLARKAIRWGIRRRNHDEILGLVMPLTVPD